MKRAADPATGERYHVELTGAIWNPTPDIIITSEQLGIVGSDIDFVNDLGIVKTKFRQIKVVLRPGKKHKLRFERTPITYDAERPPDRLGRVQRDPVPGDPSGHHRPAVEGLSIRLRVRLRHRDRGFAGLILEAKYTDVQATLSNGFLNEFARARAPIPALGGIARVYLVPNISITGEFSGIKLPDNINNDYRAKYFDFDMYGTVNFTNNVGAQVGYRSLDVLYKVHSDQGTLKLKGPYVGGVVRF